MFGHIAMHAMKMSPVRSNAKPCRLQIFIFGLWLMTVVVVVGSFLSKPQASNDSNRQIAALSAQLKHLRKELSKLTCDKYGVSTTGAFCVPNPLTEEFRQYRLANFDAALAGGLKDFFRAAGASSVADVGGSIGLYADALTAGGVPGVTCYDGADNIEGATGGKVKHLDVTDTDAPQALGLHDWVLCLEVAEHVPRPFEDAMVDMLVQASRTGLVMSWAPPGQSGHHHVNEKPHDQVKAMLVRKGMHFDDAATQQLRAIATLPQFQRNLLVFRR